jgi:hypothetical protein
MPAIAWPTVGSFPEGTSNELFDPHVRHEQGDLFARSLADADAGFTGFIVATAADAILRSE